MSDLAISWFPALLRASIYLAVAGMLALLAIRLMRPKSIFVNRFAWMSVLVTGIVVFPLTIQLPWYEPEMIQTAAWSAGVPVSAYAETSIEVASNDMALPSTVGRQAPGTAWTWQAWLALTWLIGAALLMSGWLLAYCALLRSLRACRSLSPEDQRLCQAVESQLPWRTKASVMLHDHLGPMLAAGPGGYRIVLPEHAWNQLTDDEKRAVLLHEHEHLRRGDVWKSLVARILAAVHWYNPIAWLAARRFEEAAEWACDDAAAGRRTRDAASLARALLQIAVPRPATTLASAFARPPVSHRIRRLLGVEPNRRSRLPNAAVSTLALALVAAASVQIELVAESPSESPERQGALDRRIETFAAQLSTTDSEDLAQLAAGLQTRAGKVALQQRADHAAWEIRSEAVRMGVDDYFDRHFNVSESGNYTLKPDQADFQTSLMKASRTFAGDVETVAETLSTIRKNLVGDTDEAHLIRRFLEHDAAATMIYLQGVRERVRPTPEMVAEVFYEWFEPSESGQLVIVNDRRDDAEEWLARIEAIEQHTPFVSEELREWASEFAQTDDLSKKFKAILEHPLFPAAFAADHFDDARPEEVAELFEHLFHFLEDITVDTGNGIELRNEARIEIRELLSRLPRITQSLMLLDDPIDQVASQLDYDDPLSARFKNALATNAGRVRIASYLELPSANVEPMVQALLDEFFVKQNDGSYQLYEDHSAEFAEHVQNLFREYREMRRELRRLNRRFARIADEQLRQAHASFAGMLAMFAEIEDVVSKEQTDGLEVWLARHFELHEQQYFLRDGAEQELTELLEDIAKIGVELEHNDF